MADENRSFAPKAVQAHRAKPKGRGVGQKDLSARGGGDRNAAGLGQDDNPQADWVEAVDEGAALSAASSRKGIRTEADRAQGAKTRQRTKDIISRRP